MVCFDVQSFHYTEICTFLGVSESELVKKQREDAERLYLGHDSTLSLSAREQSLPASVGHLLLASAPAFQAGGMK